MATDFEDDATRGHQGVFMVPSGRSVSGDAQGGKPRNKHSLF